MAAAQEVRGRLSEAGHAPQGKTAALALGALGVVYGDIGTNPLFALQDCFVGPSAIAADATNIFGVLSLVFWALVLVVSVKYLGFVMRVSNQGEGGILALLALLPKDDGRRRWARVGLVLLVLFGAALLYGDGVVTPAISVLSAVEGLALVAPSMAKLVVPLTVVILLVLFKVQRRGTEGIGYVFGPIMVIWFLAIAALGLWQIAGHSEVLAALDPRHAVRFFSHGGRHALVVLGAVVLTIAGGEALYADMGHFGRRPIALGWYVLVLPALLLSYFGQGAFLLGGGAAGSSTFYAIVPRALLLPTVILATAATVIASQALISGAYSLTQQAIQLGYFPRVQIVHTSAGQFGQIYVPFINAALAVACIALVLGFGASSKLAAAYGLAVSGTMTITSVAFFVVLLRTWRWPWWRAGALVAAFLVIDLAFLVANLDKFFAGGWVPVGIGLAAFTVMTTWLAGRQRLARHFAEAAFPLGAFVEDLAAHELPRVRGTGVFMTANSGTVPPVLLHHVKHNQVLHEQVVVCTIVADPVPYVAAARRVDVESLGQGVWQVAGHLGFMETPNVPELLRHCASRGLTVDPGRVSFYLGRETLIPSRRKGLWRWQKRLFAFINRNAQSAPGYFGMPPNRVVELGMQVEIDQRMRSGMTVMGSPFHCKRRSTW